MINGKSWRDLGFDQYMTKTIPSGTKMGPGEVRASMGVGALRGQQIYDGAIKNVQIASSFRAYQAVVSLTPGEGDYNNIQDAIDYVANDIGYGTVFIRAGTYTITSDITGSSKVNLVGEGIDQTILDFDNNAVGLIYDTKTDFRLSGFTVQNADDALGGIVLRSCGRFGIDSVKSKSCLKDGFYISACYIYVVNGCIADSNTESGFRFHSENYGNKDNYDYTVLECVSDSNGAIGFRTTTADAYTHFHFSFLGCSASGNTGDGFSLEDGTNIIDGTIVGCHGGNNSGWTLDINAARLSVIGCSNSSGTQFLRTASTCQQVSIAECSPAGDFDLQGEVSAVGLNIGSILAPAVSPFEEFDERVDTGTVVMGTYGGNTTTERVVYQMKNGSGGSLAAGDVVTFKADAAGDLVTTTTAQGDDLVFGMALEAITDTSYGLVLVNGYTKLLKVDGTTDIAIGDFLGTFTTAKIAMKASAGDMAIAIALEAYATNDSSGVIDALIVTPRKI